MDLWYVMGTVIVKKEEVTDLRAVPVKNGEKLEDICNESYIRWEQVSGPHKMSEYWEG